MKQNQDESRDDVQKDIRPEDIRPKDIRPENVLFIRDEIDFSQRKRIDIAEYLGIPEKGYA